MATTKQKASSNGGQPTPAQTQIDLQPLEHAVIEVPIIGETPLILHKWSEKAKRQMRDKQQGKPAAKKAPKDPATEARDATHWMPDGITPGMPAAAFKAATADAARYFQGITMTDLKRVLFVLGEQDTQLVPLNCTLEMHEDPARIDNGRTTDLRYRNYAYPWSALLRVRYVASMITATSVIALVDAGGNNGVGDWRPSSPKSMTGIFGRYRVDYDEVQA